MEMMLNLRIVYFINRFFHYGRLVGSSKVMRGQKFNLKLVKVTEHKSDFEMELGDDEGFHIDNYSGNEKPQSDDQQLILVSRYM